MRLTRTVEAVQPRAIIPEDLSLARVGDRQLQEEVGRLGEVRVRVRVIGREDQRVVAELLDDPLDLVLVDVDADEALPQEVLARQSWSFAVSPLLDICQYSSTGIARGSPGSSGASVLAATVAIS